MSSNASLLPPNATDLETALAEVGLRLENVDMPIADLWNPATCPIAALPWLAWTLSIDRWDAEWTDERKRAATASAIADQRRKGSVAAVREAMTAIDGLLELVEWHQASPRRTPHTFELRLPVVGRDGVAGGARCSVATTMQIIADVTRVAPARSQFDVVLDLTVAGAGAVRGAARTALYRRMALPGTDTSGIAWGALLQTEAGEPLTDDTGEFLDGSAA
ncbi:phage tail protein I [Novosphingobium sp.]|uniref:phage tail protein I n=1 Tax=Novosphingobium sp. TaxID=1874826 RepID=UPI002FDDB5A0